MKGNKILISIHSHNIDTEEVFDIFFQTLYGNIL
jgi:hypothetical protein